MIRPTQPAAWPLTDPRTTEGKKATELHGAWTKQFARVEKVEAEAEQVNADLRAAEAAISDASSAKTSEAAEKAYAAAKEAAEGPWQARLLGPVRGSEQAEADFREYVTANLAAILGEPELNDAADAARDSVVGAAEDLLGALEEWRRIAKANEVVIALGSGEVRSLPSLTPAAKAIGGAAEELLADEDRGTVAGPSALRAPKPTADFQWRQMGAELSSGGA